MPDLNIPLPHLRLSLAAVLLTSLGGCSDMLTRFNYSDNGSGSAPRVHQDVQTTASIPNAGQATYHQPVAIRPVGSAPVVVAVQPVYPEPALPQATPASRVETLRQPVRSANAITFSEYRARQAVLATTPTAATTQVPLVREVVMPWQTSPATNPVNPVATRQAPEFTASVPMPASFSETRPVTSQTSRPRRVEVVAGDTLYSLARKYHTSVDDLAAANKIQNNYIQVGQVLVIPDQLGEYLPERAASQTVKTVPQPLKVASRSGAPVSDASHIVLKGESLGSVARDYGVDKQSLASSNGLALTSPLNPGMILKLPSDRIKQTSVASYKPKRDDVEMFTQSITYKSVDMDKRLAKMTDKATSQSPTQVVHALPSLPKKRQPYKGSSFMPSARKTVKAVNTSLEATSGIKDTPIITQDVTSRVVSTTPKQIDGQTPNRESQSFAFRWPVQGRVIRHFGTLPGGEVNEGINIAVPEGTLIHAAEAGEVTYAGSDYPKMGNLVVIRHSHDWVTIYAHNKSLMVKRGDKVAKGQAISEAGTTGGVDIPQLHFEMRKSAQAHNPLLNLPKT